MATPEDDAVAFPIVCESCLGNNPYMRMTTQNQGKECKNCSRPFTSYRWVPSAGERTRSTEICSSCAKVKNVCQCCILDLEYGLSTQVRDAILGLEKPIQGDANRKWALRAAEDTMAKIGRSTVDYGRIDSVAKETLKRLARGGADPYPVGGGGPNRRHLPGVCSYWLKGKCPRGKECPYKHELPKSGSSRSSDSAGAGGDVSTSGHRDGGGTPAVIRGHHILDRHVEEAKAQQANSSTVLVTGIPEGSTTETALRAHFEQFGEVKSVVIAVAKRSAFVNYVKREGATAAIDAGNEQQMDGKDVKVTWGRSRLNTSSTTGSPRPPTAAAPPTSSQGESASGRPQRSGARYEYSAMNPALIN